MPTPQILFVDDASVDWAPFAGRLSRITQKLDCELVIARSIQEAERDVALVLLAVGEDLERGLEEGATLHAQAVATPFMFVFAKDIDASMQAAAYRAGAVDVFHSSVDAEVLQAKLAAFVALSRKNMQTEMSAETLTKANASLQAQRERDLASINERKQAEEALRQSQEELRQLASYQDRIKEDERKRIAREIHDELGQNLLALRLDVSMLHARTGNTHPRLHRKVRAVLDHIDATMKAMRSIINNLRPTVLDLGLNAAIEWQVKEFQRRSGIDCRLLMQENELELDDTRATALFRILQESLNNVLRHAQATRVEIELRQDDGVLSMRIADNGVGMYPGCRRKGNSFGLIGIKERISALGGTMAIDTRQKTDGSSGTTLTVSIPVEEKVKPAASEQESMHADAHVGMH